MSALPSNDRLRGPMVATGGQTDFPADFPLIRADAIRVFIQRGDTRHILSGESISLQSITDSGFTARITPAAQAGDKVWVYSDIDASRLRAHAPNGAIRTSVLETDATEFQAQLQELRRDVARSVKVEFGDTATAQSVFEAFNNAKNFLPTYKGVDVFVRVRVPSQFKTFQAALNFAYQFFGPGGVFQIDLDAGTHKMSDLGQLVLNRPIGMSLRIVGNANNPDAHVIEVDGPSKTLFVASGMGSGAYVNGIKLKHTNINNRLDTIAVLADDGGLWHFGGACRVDGFFWNLFARRGGIIRADSGGKYVNGGDTNALAYIGGVVSVVGCELTGADDLLSSLGSGAVCEGGSLDISFAKLNGNKRAGLHCIEGYVRAMGTEFNGNVNNGVAQDGGHVDLTTGCVASNNGTYGYRHAAGEAGGIGSLTGTGNGTALYKPLRKLEDGASQDRNYALIAAAAGGRWHDNVLGIQNKSIHDVAGRGNAAINFLDSAGTEKGALGYSRNSGLAPDAGYIADTVYVEFGNPFDTVKPSHFRLICTMKAGSAWWGGAYTAYDVIHVDPTTGDITVSGNGTGVTYFRDSVAFGRLNTPKEVRFFMGSGVEARMRERAGTANFTIATNVKNMGAAITEAVTKDDTSRPSWSIGFGGSGNLDAFIVHRAATGTGQVMAEVINVGPAGTVKTAATGNPEGAVTAPVGTLYPSANGSLYFKATGTGNTGWKAVTLAS